MAIAALAAAAATVLGGWVGTASARSRIAWVAAVDPAYDGVVRLAGPAECGPAALAMVLDHHGVEATVSQLASQAGTDAAGTSLLALKRAAERWGADAQGWRLSYADLRTFELPVLAHVHGDHFVVVRSVGSEVVVDDPSLGRLRMTDRVFRGAWNGIVMTVAVESMKAQEEIG